MKKDPTAPSRRHPVRRAVLLVALVIVIATVANHPLNSAIGFAILAAGIPVCRYWQARNRPAR